MSVVVRYDTFGSGTVSPTADEEGTLAATELEGPDAGLIGRASQLAFLDRAVAQGGCVISGEVGVGKTCLALEAAARTGLPVRRATATRAASSMPFGALAHLLPSARPGPGAITACLDDLRRIDADGELVLLVDDAHLLDAASAALLLAVCETAAARVVVTVRPRPVPPDAITALWKDQALARLDLEPLSRQELRELVEAFLGGRADPEVHRRLFELTEGNPLYARELLDDARRSAALREEAGTWRWTGRPPELRRLVDLVDARLAGLTAEGRAALEVLSLGIPLRLRELWAASTEAGVAELERAGLAEVGGKELSAPIELAHPVFGEVTLAALPATSAQHLRRRLADVLREGGLADPFDLVRVAAIELDAGADAPDLFGRAAACALHFQAGVPAAGWGGTDPALAIRLADAAGPSLQAALCGAYGHMALTRYAEVEPRLAPVEDQARLAPVEEAVAYVRTRVQARHRSGETDAALALLERSIGWRDDAGWELVHRTLRAWVELDRARPAAALDALGSSLPPPDVPAQARLDALVACGVAYSRLGLVDRCEALEPTIRAVAGDLTAAGFEVGWSPHLVDGMARVEAARDLAGTVARLTAARGAALARGDLQLAAALGMVVGRAHLIAGHAREAIEVLEDSVVHLTAGDPRGGLSLTLSYLACALALVGEGHAARVRLTRAEEVARERPSNRREQMNLARARIWVGAADGRTTAAIEDALRPFGDAQEVVIEAEAVYDALRLGAPAPRCADRLEGLASRAESDLLDASAAHAAALAAADATAQLHAAERFAGLGLDLFAAEAARGATVALLAEGRTDRARQARALAVEHAARCPGVRTPPLARRPESAGLTPREREVANLVARGLSNAEVAEALVLSVRTVETYVLRACRKLGVERRTALAGALLDQAPSAEDRSSRGAR